MRIFSEFVILLVIIPISICYLGWLALHWKSFARNHVGLIIINDIITNTILIYCPVCLLCHTKGVLIVSALNQAFQLDLRCKQHSRNYTRFSLPLLGKCSWQQLLVYGFAFSFILLTPYQLVLYVHLQ